MSLLEPPILGVGIDTARYGHHVTFLRPDKQPAAPPLEVIESRAGYQQLQQQLEQLYARHPEATFYVRMDVAGQYATNLEQFLQGLPLPLVISAGEPGRNAAYRKAHSPKRKADPTESYCAARFAVVEQPPAMWRLPREIRPLREAVGRLSAQVKQTTRALQQLHQTLARVFPELAVLTSDLSAGWVLAMLSKYPTPERLARAQRESLTSLPRLGEAKAQAVQQAARTSVGSLQGELAESLVKQAVQAVQQSQAHERTLEKLVQQALEALPEGGHRQIATIPGIGAATAAVLVAKIVSIDRFATDDQLVSYFGLFPQEESSGVDRQGQPLPPGPARMSRQGCDLVRRYLWCAAQSAARFNPAVRALYRRQKQRNKKGSVALGHCMAKLVRLVFAVWKSNQEFDPHHYPWEPAETSEPGETSQPGEVSSVPQEKSTADAAAPFEVGPKGAAELGTLPARAAGGENKAAAGHTQEVILPRKVVTAATGSLEPASPQVKPRPQPQAPERPLIDYAALRALIYMEQVLDQLGWLGRLRGRRPQLRGPCPVHGHPHDARRSFSVNLERQTFRCFYPSCSAQGNPLDLWAAVKHLPLYEAATDLAATLGVPLPVNREEEPVSLPRKPR